MRAWAIASSLLLAIALLGPPAASAQPKGDDESAELVAEGRRALARRDYADAAKALDQAIALNPRRIEAYVLRAAIHTVRGEYRQGVTLLRKAEAQAPGNLDVLSLLGRVLYLGGRVADGVAVLEKVVAKDPARYDAQALLARHHRTQRSWAAVVVALEAYFKSRPAELRAEDPQRQIELAEAYLRTGKPSKARTLYRKALKVRPKDPAARMGVGWALAAIDCTKARPVLAKLSDLTEKYPEIELVAGQCELALGAAAAALRKGQRYLARIGELERKPAATGYALVGEAAAATGDLALARSSLATARELEPGQRRWALKLAVVLRRAGEGAAALVELDGMGAPASPAAEPVWWREVGEALIVDGKPAEVATRLAPALEALPGDAALRTIAGEAALRAGDPTAAIVHLDAAERAGSSTRSRAWLIRALDGDAAARLTTGDLAGAETALARAVELGGGAVSARNLGITRLALGRAADAIAPLEKSADAEPAAETLLALGRAHLAAGAVDPARAAYQRAAAAAKGSPLAVEVAIDRAALEVEAGQGGVALDALDAVAGVARKAGGDLLAAYREASRAAHHAAGVAALRAGSASKAVGLLEDADELAGGKDLAVRCDLALATVATGDRDAALKRLRGVAKVTCPFPEPADTKAVPILIAFIEGLDARRSDKALKALAKLERKATGATRRLLATATRVVALTAAENAYRDGDLKKARKLLQQAKAAESRAGADEVSHNLAVLDIVDGKLGDAVAVLERLAGKLPEAAINLGVADDRRGDGEAALGRWRQARRAGARFAPLDDWIAAKERIYGKGGEP